MANIGIFPPLTPELYVRNLGESLEFYIGLLGFSICFERPENNFATIELDGAFIMLEQIDNLDPNNDPWVTAKLEYPLGRGINFQITVTDLDGIHSRLLRYGYPIKLPLEQKSYRTNNSFLNIRQLMIMDPDGYLLRLSQFIA
ncbi:VOC family protein [Pseudomonas sp.]|uniref:bleomycin resistance protein n=1 Tax=Pseudomonas sp. TaxID=306 RepID=UPI002C7988EC|nr:VOC family protein [Pseudomonas sp.]HUE94116.1 VOC family protein [Pseudomonas sp.]